MQEIEASIAVVTETWMRDGQDWQVLDLSLGAGAGIVYRSRPPNRNGVLYGGVAVVWREKTASFKKLDIESAEHEVIVVGGKLKGYGRKLVVVAAYLPLNLTLQKADTCMSFVADAVVEVKRKSTDPFVVVAGDFNQ